MILAKLLFHQPRFPWNKWNSLTKPPFGVRSCEVAIIWPNDWRVLQLFHTFVRAESCRDRLRSLQSTNLKQSIQCHHSVPHCKFIWSTCLQSCKCYTNNATAPYVIWQDGSTNTCTQFFWPNPNRLQLEYAGIGSRGNQCVQWRRGGGGGGKWVSCSPQRKVNMKHGEEIPTWSLTVRPWKVTIIPKGSRIIFQPSVFQGRTVKLQGSILKSNPHLWRMKPSIYSRWLGRKKSIIMACPPTPPQK